MKKQLIARSLIIPLLCMFLLLSSCSQREFEYSGDHPQLYTVAVNSILGADGYRRTSWGRRAPLIRVRARDSYGRVLFTYSEGESNSDYSSETYFLIMQKVEGNYAYFYPHFNVIASSFTEFRDREEQLNILRTFNRWSRAMSDDSAFERVRIARRKGSGPISDRRLLDAYHEVFADPNIYRQRTAETRMRFLRTDRYGRSVYLAIGAGSRYRDTYIAVVFQADRTFDLENGTLEITDRNIYRTELRQLKETNGWNTPP